MLIFLLLTPEEKGAQMRARHRWEDNNEMDLKGTG
jgi:hypothetical protein